MTKKRQHAGTQEVGEVVGEEVGEVVNEHVTAQHTAPQLSMKLVSPQHRR